MPSDSHAPIPELTDYERPLERIVEARPHETAVWDRLIEAGWVLERFGRERFDFAFNSAMAWTDYDAPLRQLPDFVASHPVTETLAIIDPKGTTNADSATHTVAVPSLETLHGLANLMGMRAWCVWHDMTATPVDLLMRMTTPDRTGPHPPTRSETWFYRFQKRRTATTPIDWIQHWSKGWPDAVAGT